MDINTLVFEKSKTMQELAPIFAKDADMSLYALGTDHTIFDVHHACDERGKRLPGDTVELIVSMNLDMDKPLDDEYNGLMLCSQDTTLSHIVQVLSGVDEPIWVRDTQDFDVDEDEEPEEERFIALAGYNQYEYSRPLGDMRAQFEQDRTLHLYVDTTEEGSFVEIFHAFSGDTDPLDEYNVILYIEVDEENGKLGEPENGLVLEGHPTTLDNILDALAIPQGLPIWYVDSFEQKGE